MFISVRCFDLESKDPAQILHNESISFNFHPTLTIHGSEWSVAEVPNGHPLRGLTNHFSRGETTAQIPIELSNPSGKQT